MNHSKLKPVWLKAAVLGCLWASSEIVLGSFLHNLRIPFSSNLLTGIGIVLVVSVGHIWRERGLIWRAGLVCALMKSLSPSAVIFGPMIAIFTEALLIEISIVIFRRSWIGWLLAGALAMSWNLAHMLLNKLLFYGMDLVDIYATLISFLEKQLSFRLESLWGPVLAAFSVYVLLGMLTAAAGIFIGRKLRRTGAVTMSLKAEKIKSKYLRGTVPDFPWSGWWLAFILISLPASMAVAPFLPFPWSLAGFVIFISVVISRYRRALQPLKKLRFWMSFIVITFLAGGLLGYLSLNSLWLGLITGLEMNVRAAAMITGFAALGTELKSPAVKKILHRRRTGQLVLSLETAVETLPLVISNLPDLKSIFRRPFSVLSQLVSQAGFWLERLEIKSLSRKKICIISGPLHMGKTTFTSDILGSLEKSGLKATGFLSPAVFENQQRTGFDLLLLPERERIPFSRIRTGENDLRIGQYAVDQNAYDRAVHKLQHASESHCDLVVIDEIGPWELENQGWASAINHLMKESDLPMIWVVREQILDRVLAYWSPSEPLIIRITKDRPEDVLMDIKNLISSDHSKENPVI
jgi:nucleoside-triphosphatase THEP1